MPSARESAETSASPQRAGGAGLAVFAAWACGLVYWTWPALRWQLEHFKNPGEAYFDGIIIIAPALITGTLLYAMLRRPAWARWEPIVILSPAVVLALRHPWAVLTTLLLIGTALALGRRALAVAGLESEDGSKHWTLSLLTGISLGSWALSLVATAGGLSRTILWLVAVVPAVWSLKQIPEWRRALRGAVRQWNKDEDLQLPLAGILAPFLFLGLLSAVFVAASPPIEYDAVHFHLPLAQKWVETGTLTPSFDQIYSFYPQSFEILMAWAYALGSAPAAKAFALALSAIGFSLCWVVTRQLGGNRLAALAVLVILFSAPAVHWTASVVKNDFLMATMQVACLSCFLQWRVTRNFRWVLLGAWFLGSSFGVKHSAWFALISLCLLGASAVWSQRRRAGAILAVAALFAATASIWHVRAYLFAGDPAYPAGAALAARTIGQATAPGFTKNPFLRLATFIRMVHGRQSDFIFENILTAPMGVLFSLLLPLPLLLVRDRWSPARRLVGLVVVLSLFPWIMTTSNVRYALTLFLLFACLLAVALSHSYRGGTRAGRLILAAVTAYGLLFGWLGTLIIENSGPQIRYVLGLSPAEEYIAGVHPSYPAIQSLARMADPRDEILAVGCCDPFYYPVSWRFVCKSGEEAARALSVGGTYRYLIGSARRTQRLTANLASEVAYQDPVCTVHRLLLPGSNGAPTRSR